MIFGYQTTVYDYPVLYLGITNIVLYSIISKTIWDTSLWPMLVLEWPTPNFTVEIDTRAWDDCFNWIIVTNWHVY